MAPSKQAMIVASLAASCSTSAVAFQAPATSMQSHSLTESQMSTGNSKLSTTVEQPAAVSGTVAVSGIATLAAAAVLMANTRRASKATSSSSSKITLCAFESERGVQDPVGFFDPLGFTADGSVENFKRRR
eukprot:CAMPEP_0178400812 /NCGR_PEP_ID=MMETSP0689_2-20121128/15981_1 /TAXON_ID=160604 /ORGANISM="Amphidinium massartii, Strain CS-259" /LENGTH=130 /DNA_ID=CAMNT_0020021617 /DNA_START=59 /DNA_END=448 /DNA_ORIENTATION=+